MMQIRNQVPAIWVYTTGDRFNAHRKGELPSFLTPADRDRLERIRQARLLYQGKHREYYLDEDRTQFDFPLSRAGVREQRMYMTYNALKLISKKSADLLFGQDALIRVDDDVQQASLSALADRTNIAQRLYNAAVDCGYEGEAFIEACAKSGQVYLRAMDAAEMFPLGEVGPDGQYEAYVRRQLEMVPGSERNPIHLLLETAYTPGLIQRRVWQLDEHGAKKLQLTLDNWPIKPAAGALLPEERTGIAMNTITWIPNELDHGKPVSDYDGLIELQDELNSKQTQIARVLAKHSDPRLAAPETVADNRGGLHYQGEVFFFRSKDEIPSYITWNAELEHAFKDRSFTLQGLLITSETSPVLLGLKEGAAPTAYRTLRLEAHNSLTKAQRKATNWKPGVRRALTVCQALENTIPGSLAYAVTPIAVEMRDGIPVDEQDQADTLATLRGAKLLSVEGGLERLLNDRAAVAKEKSRLDAETAAATPTVLLGEPGEAPMNQPASEVSTEAA